MPGREARAGRPSWWHRLFTRSDNTPTSRGDVGEGPHRRARRGAQSLNVRLSEAQHHMTVLSFERLGRFEVTT